MKEQVNDKEKLGFIKDYHPNKLSLYILLLQTGRHDRLLKVLYKDMEKYKIERTEDDNPGSN
tara:strand:+ start:60 stop:245 length:186 start_codon:yes stop_codon:yes gene_type:complete